MLAMIMDAGMTAGKYILAGAAVVVGATAATVALDWAAEKAGSITEAGAREQARVKAQKKAIAEAAYEANVAQVQMAQGLREVTGLARQALAPSEVLPATKETALEARVLKLEGRMTGVENSLDSIKSGMNAGFSDVLAEMKSMKALQAGGRRVPAPPVAEVEVDLQAGLDQANSELASEVPPPTAPKARRDKAQRPHA